MEGGYAEKNAGSTEKSVKWAEKSKKIKKSAEKIWRIKKNAYLCNRKTEMTLGSYNG
ncbi:MAG: hypothetical protein NC115_12550 [Bacteroidales bacterium]|nr:hypothetical protein [Bacteroidales bacterium]